MTLVWLVPYPNECVSEWKRPAVSGVAHARTEQHTALYDPNIVPFKLMKIRNSLKFPKRSEQQSSAVMTFYEYQ